MIEPEIAFATLKEDMDLQEEMIKYVLGAVLDEAQPELDVYKRQVLVIQNDVGNRYSPTVIVLAITGQVGKARLPTHVPVPADGTGLQKDSVILAEQIRTLDKRRLRERIGSLPPEIMEKVSEAVRVSLAVGEGARERRGAPRGQETI